MAAGTAMLLGAVSLSAAMPEHLYMVGTASPSLWNLEPAQEMVNEGEGVFSYTGNLYNGELQFMNVKTGILPYAMSLKLAVGTLLMPGQLRLSST